MPGGEWELILTRYRSYYDLVLDYLVMLTGSLR